MPVPHMEAGDVIMEGPMDDGDEDNLQSDDNSDEDQGSSPEADAPIEPGIDLNQDFSGLFVNEVEDSEAGSVGEERPDLIFEAMREAFMGLRDGDDDDDDSEDGGNDGEGEKEEDDKGFEGDWDWYPFEAKEVGRAGL